MKIQSLLIENFRGIGRVEAKNLGDTIIIAGQNGSGKSCLYDAIRLLKSFYGGYHQNEWQNFFGEFAIQLNGGATNLRGLFNDHTKPIVINCTFQLRANEKAYISENLATLVEEKIWQTLLPEAFQYGGYQKALFANQFRERQPEVKERVQAELPHISTQLRANELLGSICVTPKGEIIHHQNQLLSVIFTNYKPRQIGVIDFHGAQRHYGREIVQGININLSVDQLSQQYSQHTLYNYNNKYNNVKSEMAGNFIKEMLAEKAQGKNEENKSLSETLKELFESFFPDKKFLGPKATKEGSLSFPVITANGSEHDLDELSSGEKEILYGYLRIRSSAPRDSIILLDEPELHLNPRLIRGLPEFYRKHLGEALQNQIWLVTHSDALIREAVGKPGFNVFHMIPCGLMEPGGTQLKPLTASQDLEVAIADLVGDLAAYRPGGKGLLFEGGGDSDFDKTLCSTLFPEELRGINLLSGSNKSRVKQLHELLERAYEKGDLSTKFYAIVDRDSEADENQQAKPVSRFKWDVYHIENYLLEPKIIADVIQSLNFGSKITLEKVKEQLKSAARDVIPSMLEHKMRSYSNSVMMSVADLGFDPNTKNLSNEIHLAAQRAQNRLTAVISKELNQETLAQKEQEFRHEIELSFENETWLSDIPGRKILHRYVDRERIGIPYERFRNLIVSRMVESGFKPVGMLAVINKIAAD